jgi:4-amino-4-deoxy-L-arabinose transferase-like glycosyltransferase
MSENILSFFSALRIRWIALFILLIALAPRVLFPLATSICYDEMAAKDSGVMLDLLLKGDFLSDGWAHYPYFPFYKYVFGLIPQILFGSDPSSPHDLAGPRFVGAMIGSGIVVLTFLIGIQLLGKWPAIIGALLLAFVPTVLGHDRIAMHDAPSRLLALTSWCFLIYWHKTGKRFSFVSSAIFAGLAVTFFHRTGLQSGLAIALWLAFVLMKSRRDWTSRLKYFSGYGVLSLGIFGATVWILWPYMWFRPWELARWYADPSSTIGVIGTSEHWFGKIQPVPRYYYLVALVISTPPATLLGAFFWNVKNIRGIFKKEDTLALILLVIIPLLMMSLTLLQCLAHYLQIVFPALCLMAGGFFVYLKDWLSKALVHWSRMLTLVILSIPLLGEIYACSTVSPYFMQYFNAFTGGGARVEKEKLFSLSTYGEAINPLFEYIHEKGQPNNTVLCRLGAWPGLSRLGDFIGPSYSLQGYQAVDPLGAKYVLRVGAERDNVFYRYEPDPRFYKKVMDVKADGGSLGEVWERDSQIPNMLYIDDFASPQIMHFAKGSQNIQLNPFQDGKLHSAEFGKPSELVVQLPSLFFKRQSELKMEIDLQMRHGKLEVYVGSDLNHLKQLAESNPHQKRILAEFKHPADKDLFILIKWISYEQWDSKPSTFWNVDWVDALRIYSK